MNLANTSSFEYKCTDRNTFTEKDMEVINFFHSNAVLLRQILAELKYAISYGKWKLMWLFFSWRFHENRDQTQLLEAMHWGSYGFPGEWLKPTTHLVDFLIMDIPSAYNGIFGRTSQFSKGVILFFRHQMIKFPTEYDIGSVHGDKPTTRNCYYSQVIVTRENSKCNLQTDLEIPWGE